MIFKTDLLRGSHVSIILVPVLSSWHSTGAHPAVRRSFTQLAIILFPSSPMSESLWRVLRIRTVGLWRGYVKGVELQLSLPTTLHGISDWEKVSVSSYLTARPNSIVPKIKNTKWHFPVTPSNIYKLFARRILIGGQHFLPTRWLSNTIALATDTRTVGVFLRLFNPYPTAFPYGNGMVLHFYQQQESSTTKTVHKVINKGLKAYV